MGDNLIDHFLDGQVGTVDHMRILRDHERGGPREESAGSRAAI